MLNGKTLHEPFEPHIDAIEEEKWHCPKECCIKVLVLWMNREGDEATAARLADEGE